MDRDDFLLFFTTAGGQKANYRRGILDAICYPPGHVIRYHYRFKQLSKATVDLSMAENVPGLIVYVDSAADMGQVSYYPLRRVNVTQMPPLLAMTGSKENRVEFSLRLAEYVNYLEFSKQYWNDVIAKFDDRRDIVRNRPTYFVTAVGETFCVGCGIEDDVAWETLARVLYEARTINPSVYLRLSNPYAVVQDRKSIIARYDRNRLLSTYQVRPGYEYHLDIKIFDPPLAEDKVPQHQGRFETSERSSGTTSPKGAFTHVPTVLEVRSSTDQVYVVQPFQSVASGRGERTAIISCKRTIEPVLTSILILVTGKDPSVTTNDPQILLEIRPSILMLTGFLILVLLGTGFLTMDSGFCKWVCGDTDTASVLYVVSRIGAVFFLTSAAFVAYRKLPSSTSK